MNVAAVEALRVQLLFSTIVRIPDDAEVLDVAHPTPAKPVTGVTVGEAGRVKLVGHSTVIVLPVIAVIALVSVNPTVHVEVARAW